MMDKAINLLQTALEKELALYRRYLTVVREENNYLINNGLEGLRRTLAEKEVLAEAIQECEEQRLEACGEFAAQQGLPVERIRIKDLAANLPEPQRGRLNALKEMLDKTLQEVKVINRSNTLLIQGGLQIIQKTFELVTGAAGPGGEAYLPSGQTQPKSGGQRNLLNKVA